jgi:hypothetical protein
MVSTWDSNYRNPSSVDKNSSAYNLEQKLNCQKKERKACLRLYPYSLLKRKWTEVFEYQFLNRRNIVQAKYLNCSLEGNISCALKYNYLEEAARLEEIKDNYDYEKQIASSKSNTLLNGMKKRVDWNSDQFIFQKIKLSARDLKRIWTNLYSIHSIFQFMYSKVQNSKEKVSSKVINSLHGVGLGFTPKASVGIGAQVNFESIVHNGKLGFFCAPGVQVESDVGVSASVNLIKTFGCKSNQEYAGKFFTVSAGLSAESLGLPVSIGGSYSIALGLKEILRELADAKVNGNFEVTPFLRELDDFSVISAEKLIEIFGNQRMASASIIVLKMMAKLAGKQGIDSYEELSRKLKEIQSEKGEKIKISNYFPLGVMLRKMTEQLKGWVEEKGDGELPHTLIFLDILARNLDSCDAISGQAGLSFTLSPISIGASLYQYVEVGEVDLRDLFYLMSLGPIELAKISSNESELNRFKSTLKRTLKNLPSYERFSICATNAKESFEEEFTNLKTIFSSSEQQEF